MGTVYNKNGGGGGSLNSFTIQASGSYTGSSASYIEGHLIVSSAIFNGKTKIKLSNLSNVSYVGLYQNGSEKLIMRNTDTYNLPSLSGDIEISLHSTAVSDYTTASATINLS